MWTLACHAAFISYHENFLSLRACFCKKQLPSQLTIQSAVKLFEAPQIMSVHIVKKKLTYYFILLLLSFPKIRVYCR